MVEIEHPITKMTPCRIILSTCGIVYVWSLPFLAVIGFAEPDSTSISSFISNAPATGAMAAISFMPLTLMWEYQDIVITYKKNQKGKNELYYSIMLFQFFYGAFLTCTVCCVPMWLHSTTVIIFGTSFLIHCAYILKYIEPTYGGTCTLVIGVSAFISLLFVQNMWFWAMECIGFSSMLLFTPIELYLISKNSFYNNDDASTSMIVVRNIINL